MFQPFNDVLIEEIAIKPTIYEVREFNLVRLIFACHHESVKEREDVTALCHTFCKGKALDFGLAIKEAASKPNAAQVLGEFCYILKTKGLTAEVVANPLKRFDRHGEQIDLNWLVSISTPAHAADKKQEQDRPVAIAQAYATIYFDDSGYTKHEDPLGLSHHEVMLNLHLALEACASPT